MGALIEGLLDLFQWLALTVNGFFTWLWSTVSGVVRWLWSVLDWVLATAWNWFVEVLYWALAALFSILGVLVTLPVKLVTVLVGFLPEVPLDFQNNLLVIIPAFSVADRILPISDALTMFSLWGLFYGMMAVWRLVTFIRGGR